MVQFHLKYLTFPAEAHGILAGATRYNVKKNRYTIFIDDALPEQQRQSTLRHELAHIVLNHLQDFSIDLDQAEHDADEYAENMTEEEFKSLMAYQV